MEKEFTEWVAKWAYCDIRGKYRIYKMGIKDSFNSLDDVYEYWIKNIK